MIPQNVTIQSILIYFFAFSVFNIFVELWRRCFSTYVSFQGSRVTPGSSFQWSGLLLACDDIPTKTSSSNPSFWCPTSQGLSQEEVAFPLSEPDELVDTIETLSPVISNSLFITHTLWLIFRVIDWLKALFRQSGAGRLVIKGKIT